MCPPLWKLSKGRREFWAVMSCFETAEANCSEKLLKDVTYVLWWFLWCSSMIFAADGGFEGAIVILGSFG